MNLAKSTIWALAFSLSLAACTAPQPAENAESAVAESAVKKYSGVWIDVRSPEEFAQGHINGAVNIPVDRIAARISSVSPDKNAPVNLYCRSGRRAQTALEALQKLGYTQVSNHGGYQDLLQKGLR